MLMHKQERTLVIFDLIAIIISLLGIIVTTAIVILIDNNLREVFIGQLIILILVFTNSVKKVEKYIKENIVLKSTNKIISEKTLLYK